MGTRAKEGMEQRLEKAERKSVSETLPRIRCALSHSLFLLLLPLASCSTSRTGTADSHSLSRLRRDHHPLIQCVDKNCHAGHRRQTQAPAEDLSVAPVHLMDESSASSPV